MFCDTNTAPATKNESEAYEVLQLPSKNDVNIADPNSTTVPQNEHFELPGKTDFKSTKYCACHGKCTFFSTSNFEQPLRRFCTPLKTFTFCNFPISENRHGAQARTHLRNGPRQDPVSRRRNANSRSRSELFTGRVAKKAERVSAHHRFTPNAFHLP